MTCLKELEISKQFLGQENYILSEVCNLTLLNQENGPAFVTNVYPVKGCVTTVTFVERRKSL